MGTGFDRTERVAAAEKVSSTHITCCVCQGFAYVAAVQLLSFAVVLVTSFDCKLPPCQPGKVCPIKDERLLRDSSQCIRCKMREPSGMLARCMLLESAGFLEDFNAESMRAVESIVHFFFLPGPSLATCIAKALVW